MHLKRTLFRDAAQPDEGPNDRAPQVIETSGVEVLEAPFSEVANANGALGPVAECAKQRAKTIPFASTLPHVA